MSLILRLKLHQVLFAKIDQPRELQTYICYRGVERQTHQKQVTSWVRLGSEL